MTDARKADRGIHSDVPGLRSHRTPLLPGRQVQFGNGVRGACGCCSRARKACVRILPERRLFPVGKDRCPSPERVTRTSGNTSSSVVDHSADAACQDNGQGWIGPPLRSSSAGAEMTGRTAPPVSSPKNTGRRAPPPQRSLPQGRPEIPQEEQERKTENIFGTSSSPHRKSELTADRFRHSRRRMSGSPVRPIESSPRKAGWFHREFSGQEGCRRG